MPAKIAVVDYCKGNLASVQRGLSDTGFDARVTANPADISAADGIVLPGVGAFADAMTTMTETGQADALRAAIADGIPFLGICLGLHLMLEWGDEGCEGGGRMEGLSAVEGHVERMAAHDEDGAKHKVPHVGWNTVDFARPTPGGWSANPLFAGVPDHSYFYFTHSYCAVPEHEDDVAATTVHARRFVSALSRGTAFGVQFHPEKSSALGLRVLGNFGKIVETLA